MMNTFTTAGMNGLGTGAFWLHLHWFFIGLSVVGLILFSIWAVKNLRADKLKALSIWVLVAGIIGMLLTAPFSATGFVRMMHSINTGNNMMMNNGSMMMPFRNDRNMQGMMEMMMDHDEGVTGEEHDEHEEMRQMMQNMMRR